MTRRSRTSAERTRSRAWRAGTRHNKRHRNVGTRMSDVGPHGCLYIAGRCDLPGQHGGRIENRAWDRMAFRVVAGATYRVLMEMTW